MEDTAGNFFISSLDENHGKNLFTESQSIFHSKSERGEEKEEEGNDENFFMFISSHFSGHAFNFLLTIVEK